MAPQPAWACGAAGRPPPPPPLGRRPACALVSLRRVPPPAAPHSRRDAWRQEGTSAQRSAAFAVSAADAEELGAAEVERRVEKAVALITTSDKLVPYDPAAVNLGLVVWRVLAEVPAAARPRVVAALSSADVRRLWKVAGARYAAPAGAVAAALGPEYSLWRDLPEDSSQVVYYAGKAALPTHAFGVSSFRKAFFCARGRGDASGDDALFGRVLHATPVGNRLYPGPLYFRATIGAALVPALGAELCDAVLEYEEHEELGLAPGELPKAGWPRPRLNPRPFDAGFTNYVRAAGPGVLVGLGYRTRAAGSGIPLVPSPLYFAMARSGAEAAD
jgi:hypothetical protein